MIIKSPLYYAGNKFRLIEQLKVFIPSQIGTFYDLFGGSGTIILNFIERAKKGIYNEYDKNIFSIVSWLLTTDYAKIDAFIKSEQAKWHLDTKEGFYKYRDWINSNGLYNDPKYQYCISNFSFSNALTYNLDGRLSVGYGERIYKPDIIELNLKQAQWVIKGKRFELTNCNALEVLEKTNFNDNDYVYLDPPYYNTNVEYNKFWKWEQEEKMLQLLDKLNAKGIKWGMSNIANDHLIEWANQNGYNINYISITYNANGVKAKDYQEVFITNYIQNKQLSIFDMEV